eukprot:gene32512-17218_t
MSALEPQSFANHQRPGRKGMWPKTSLTSAAPGGPLPAMLERTSRPPPKEKSPSSQAPSATSTYERVGGNNQVLDSRTGYQCYGARKGQRVLKEGYRAWIAPQARLETQGEMNFL